MRINPREEKEKKEKREKNQNFYLSFGDINKAISSKKTFLVMIHKMLI